MISETENYKTIDLEKIALGFQYAISEYLLDTQADIVINQIRREAIVSIRGYVWGENKSLQHKEITYPCDWWQAFKARWFSGWLKKLFPVEYTKIVLDVKAIYPTLKVRIPNHEYRLIIQERDYL
jgi:hypothetical protein